VVTALNSIIGYEKGAEIVKESVKSGRTIREIAIMLAQGGKLTRRDTDQAVTPTEITNALSDLYRMTEGGIMDEIE
jgi:fumarate hydratase class II